MGFGDLGITAVSASPTAPSSARCRAEGETIAARSGVGIPGMRSRLREFGGSLEIRSGPGGTTLNALVPLDGATRRPRRDRVLELATALGGSPHRT